MATKRKVLSKTAKAVAKRKAGRGLRLVKAANARDRKTKRRTALSAKRAKVRATRTRLRAAKRERLAARALNKRTLKSQRKAARIAHGKVRRREARAARRARKRAKRLGRSFKILQDTGRLVASITPDWDATFWEAYTNVRYAKYHVSKEPRRVIPLRDFFDIDQAKYFDDVADVLLAAIATG